MKFLLKIQNHIDIPTVIFGLIILGSFFKSAKAANGKPQFATEK